MTHIRLILLLIVTLSINVYSQERYNPDSILVGTNKQPEVLLVGTYHFAYYNLDAHKTDEDKQVNVLTPERQREMEALVDYIAQFKPTKIAIEADENTHEFMVDYRNYLHNDSTLKRDEREQIGFRLMKQFHLDTIYGVDASSIAEHFFNSGDSSLNTYANAVFAEYDYQSDDPFDALYDAYYRHEDSLKLVTSLLEYFKHLNSDKLLSRGFGAYLIGDFKLADNKGADALALYWYNRNLRIYRNIQQLTTSPDDRILVIFGSGHVQILRQLFESSPEYKLVKFSDL